MFVCCLFVLFVSGNINRDDALVAGVAAYQLKKEADGSSFNFYFSRKF